MGCAKMSAVYGYKFAEANRHGIILCSREHLNSLEESSLEEVKTAIRSEPFLDDYYEIGEKYIRTKNRRVSYAFAGLRQNLDAIKSKANILLNWTDEAEGVSEAAWRKLIPTIRGANDLENWVSYNPESSESATHKRFVETPPTRCIITDLNWRDNPWFSQSGLEEERQNDKRLRADTYEHVWEGGFLTITDAQVFNGKYEVKEFEAGHNWDGPYHGLDFGFSQDPTTANQMYVYRDCLYIRREANKTKLELDHTAKFIKDAIPDIEKHAVRADSARPESISYLRRHGIPNMVSVKKWPGSVADGVEVMKSFERIYIHPDCPQTAREFRLYSYKIDKNSGDIMPIIVDAHNHHIDAIRYGIGPLIQNRNEPSVRAL